MHAIVQESEGGPETLVWREAPTPTPGPGEVLVRTAAAGYNRADSLQREGHYPPPSGISEIIGLEISGTIAELGDGVSDWKQGDEVVALLAGGGYAEYVVVPAGQLLPPPEGVDLVDAAALIEVAATVVSNFDHVNLKSGETVLIHGGAGGIGSFAIPYAKSLGCTVITTASPGKLDYCRSRGADVAIDYSEDWAAAVKEATDGKGVDVILDIIGAKYLEDNVRSLGRGGRLVVIGLQKGTKGTLNLNHLLMRGATVTATSLRFRPLDEKAQIVKEVSERVWPLIADGSIELPPIERVPLKDAKRAHELAAEGQLKGKLVLPLD